MDFFKGRSIDYSKKVEVYRNLNNGKFSIRQDSLVVAHSSDIFLTDVEFVVRKAGKKKAMVTNERNVHAFAKGYLNKDVMPNMSKFICPITYNPFDNLGFRTNRGKEIKEAKEFFIVNNLCFIVE